MYLAFNESFQLPTSEEIDVVLPALQERGFEVKKTGDARNNLKCISPLPPLPPKKVPTITLADNRFEMFCNCVTQVEYC